MPHRTLVLPTPQAPNWEEVEIHRTQCHPNFEAWCEEAGVTMHRPNTMNNHGAILDDFGLGATMDALMRRVVHGHEILIGAPSLQPRAEPAERV